jgi:FtsP/CotA-like multicopper oxidase with cupredoxin domain
MAVTTTGGSLAAVVLISAGALFVPPTVDDPGYPTVHPNDNRLPAGTMVDGVLHLDLEIRQARWFPEAVDGPSVILPAIAEVGQGPEIPAPLIRVREGTMIAIRLSNPLDTTLMVYGLTTHPSEEGDTLLLGPGETREWQFDPGQAGTYPWGAVPRPRARRTGESRQMAGALIVDPATGPAPKDRVLVINIWSEPGDSAKGTEYREALAINGKSWPYTERLHSTVGDTLTWRVVNVSGRNHPMHMHGHYFRVDSRGDVRQDTIYAPEKRRLVVTEALRNGRTMKLTWNPRIPGNWLFHCHLVFHVWPEARLTHHDSTDVIDPHSGEQHMAGLVMGLKVNPRPGTPREDRTGARQLRMVIDEITSTTLWAPTVRAFTLEGDDRSGTHPASVPGPPMILTQDEPVDVTVFNRLDQPTGIHWHGLELESYSDGVAGWSGMGARIAAAVMPSDSFTAHLTLLRPGTFMYHSHLNDVDQLTSGMYGAILVLAPGEVYDPSTDHTFILAWDMKSEDPEGIRFVLNGTAEPAPVELEAGKTHRLRFINIAPAGAMRITLVADSTVPLPWTPVALDGADLPPALVIERPGQMRIDVGETADFAFTPVAPGSYALLFGRPNRPLLRQELMVR